jgi:hypothetical protein
MDRLFCKYQAPHPFGEFATNWVELTARRSTACFQAIYVKRGAVDHFGLKRAPVFVISHFSLKSQLRFLG